MTQTLAIYLAVIAGAFAAGWAVNGWRKDIAIHELHRAHSEASARLEADHATYVLQVLQSEHAAIQRAVDLDNQLAQVKADAKTRFDQLTDDLRTGAVRLSVPAARCEQTLSTDGNPATVVGQARAELDPAAAARIVAITNDGDEAIHELNSCIDRYNDVRDRLKDLNTDRVRE